MTTLAAPKPNKPTHRLYCIVGEGPEAVWTPIGAAWPNRDGAGFSIACEALPLGGRMVLRTIKPKPEAPTLI